MEPKVLRLKDIELKEFLDERITFRAVIQDASIATQRNGAYFLTLLVADKTKKSSIIKFNVNRSEVENFVIGSVYKFVVDIKSYEKGDNGISVHLISAEREDTPISEFIEIEAGYNEAYNRVLGTLREIENTTVGKIAYLLLQENWNKFSEIPAACSHHHTNQGGLLVHTATVLEISDMLASYYMTKYPDIRINLNLLRAGAILHDIGKIDEYDYEGSGQASYSELGILTPHIVSGISKVSAAAERIGASNSRVVSELIHLIASHHSKQEWGSPVEPHSIEADILSKADLIDAEVSRRVNLNADVQSGAGASKRIGGQKFPTYVSSQNSL